ncbi:MAG: hypothetical protein AB1486_08430 [Planctomycetota bacterium]
MLKTLLGLGIWMALGSVIVAAVSALPEVERGHAERAALDVVRYVTEGPARVTFVLNGDVEVRPWDGVLRIEGEEFQRIGQVVMVEREAQQTRVRAQVDPWEADRFTTTTRAELLTATRSAAWVAETLIKESTWERIRGEWELFLACYEDELTQALLPLAQNTLEEIAALLAVEVDETVEHFRPQLNRLLRIYRKEIVNEKLFPLVHDEVWPIVKKRGTDPATVIGRELWDAAPVWGFLWRGVWDSVAHDTPVSVEERWNRYVEESALPILSGHTRLIQETMELIIKDISESGRVVQTLEASLLTLRNDPRLHALLGLMAKHIVQESPRLRAYIATKLRDPSVRATLRLAGNRFQRLIDTVVNLIVLNEAHDGINPDLARLLRTMVLGKDQRLLLVQTPAGGSPRLPDAAIPATVADHPEFLR